MGWFSSIMKYSQYLPIILELSKAMMPKEPEIHVSSVAHDELENFKKDISERISEMEEEQSRLRARVRDVESALSWTQTLLYISLGALALVFILFVIIIAVVVAHH